MNNLAETTTVTHESSDKSQRVTIVLHTPNAVCRWRAESFSAKEPETLEWIEEFGGHGAFFDVGANIGLYSLYYAKLYSDQVYSFEPSVFNLGLLAKNIYVNSMSERINVVPIPSSSEDQIAGMRMSGVQEGGVIDFWCRLRSRWEGAGCKNDVSNARSQAGHFARQRHDLGAAVHDKDRCKWHRTFNS